MKIIFRSCEQVYFLLVIFTLKLNFSLFVKAMTHALKYIIAICLILLYASDSIVLNVP